MRSSRKVMTFPQPFTLSGYADELPSGEYEVVVEEELLHGLSFEAYRKTATYVIVPRKGANVGRTEMRQITDRELGKALPHGRALTENVNDSEAALSPPEDMK